ncbi:hypothetical protein ES705_10819 [subsurface metagenome]
MSKNLIEKNEIIKGVDIDGYLEKILDEYETFYFNKCDDFNYFVKETQDKLMVRLFTASCRENKDGDRRLDILNKFERKIAKRQKIRDKAIEEKRKLLILAIKKIRR